jgi:hypothetical protein
MMNRFVQTSIAGLLVITAVSSGAGQRPKSPDAPKLGIQGIQFTLNGKPTFLIGMSYYGALGASEHADVR